MTDITAPHPSTPHFRVFALAAPAALANCAVILPGIIDTLLIGRTGDAIQLGGIAVGATLAGFILWLFAFLRIGTASITSQAYDAEDANEVRATLWRALTLAWGFGFILLLVMVPLAIVTIPLFGSSDLVADLGARYFHYRLFGAPFELTNYVILGWLIGLQRPGQALALQLGINGLDAVLSYFLVIQFRLSVDGAAIATAVAQGIMALGSLYFVYRLVRRLPDSNESTTRVDLDRYFDLVSNNFYLFARTLSVVFVLLYFVGLSARMGDAALAANYVLFVLLAAIIQAFDGFVQSTEILTEPAINARDPQGLARALYPALLYAGLSAMLIAALLYFTGADILAFFTNDPPARDRAIYFLPWLAAAPIIIVWAQVLEGVFIAAGRMHEMRNALLLALFITLAAQYVLIPIFGNHGLWAALLLFFAVRGVALYSWYQRIPRAMRA